MEGNSCEFFKLYLYQLSSKRLTTTSVSKFGYLSARSIWQFLRGCRIRVPTFQALPPAFVLKLGGKIPSQCTIKDSSGKIWQVKVEAAKEGLFVANGWQEFARCHSLADGDFFVFDYDGNSQFGVKIYGKNGLQKRAPNACAGSNLVKEEQLQGVEEVRPSSGLPTRPRPPGVRPERGYKMRNLEMRLKGTSFSPACKSTGAESKSKVNPTSKPRDFSNKESTTKQEEHRSAKSTVYNPPKNPHFATYITRSTRSSLRVPRSWVNKHELELEKKMTLLTDDGISWRMEAERRGKDRDFFATVGWRQFLLANKLVHGDLCIFEMIASRAKRISKLLVHIQRRKKRSSQRRQEDLMAGIKVE